MPLGWKKNAVEETKARKFLDRRSYLSWKGGFLHEKLFGKDKSQRHDEIKNLDQEICQICKQPAPDGEWRHLENEHNGFSRCDCPGGGEWTHHTCHFDSDHKGPQWSKRESPTQDE